MAKTQNPMPNAVWKKYKDFAQKNERLRLHPETSENFYIIRALFPAASAFGGCLFLCICVAGIFVKIRLHVNTAVRVTCDVFSEVVVIARQDGI